MPKARGVWDDSAMVTHFANVSRALNDLFGTGKLAGDQQGKVERTERVIWGPHAAKRLWIALGGVLKEYETRYGALKVDGR